MRLGVLSDTHGNMARTEVAAKLLQSQGVTQIIHCGDVGDVDVVYLLDFCPCHYVRGNVDYEVELAEAVRRAGHTYHGAFGEIALEGRKIAFLHGDDSRQLQRAIASGQYALVCHGHTHHAGNSLQGTTRVLNPGAIQRTNSPSVAVVELPSLAVTPLILPDE